MKYIGDITKFQMTDVAWRNSICTASHPTHPQNTDPKLQLLWNSIYYRDVL